MLKYSKNEKIHANPPEIRTYRKWNAENKVYNEISSLRIS